MRITAAIQNPPTIGNSWDDRWEGHDKGLILCWLTGIERAIADPGLAAKARAGELPAMGWKGGLDKPIKAKSKIGAHFYLATWQGLRGDDLDIEQGQDIHITCSRTGVTVIFTDDTRRLLQQDAASEEGL